MILDYTGFNKAMDTTHSFILHLGDGATIEFGFTHIVSSERPQLLTCHFSANGAPGYKVENSWRNILRDVNLSKNINTWINKITL